MIALAAGSAGGGQTAVAGKAPARPNIVMIQTDDQTAESMRVMANTRELIGDRGATFRNHYVNCPVCCPSRATQLTGQYSHNHGVRGNSPPQGGYQAFDNDHTTAVWLQARGYTTAHVGKFLNGYGAGTGATEVPPGWDEWYTGTANSTQQVYDYTQNENGVLVEYGTDVADFKQDVLTERAVQLIDEHVGTAPLYLQLDYTAPHNGGPEPLPQPPANCEDSARPAARHANAFDSEPLPDDPSFNELDVSDKPTAIQNRPLLDEEVIVQLTRRHRCRLESLLSVDEGVAEVIDALRDNGALADTYVFFTSDNGFFTGEHRIPSGKTQIYEPSSRIPLLLRGPRIPADVNVRDLTINADLAATVVAVAGAQSTLTIDGRSLLPAARNPWIERGRELLIDTHRYKAIHTQRYVWVEYPNGDRELYDLRVDPFQLRSRHEAPAYERVRTRLRSRLAALQGCAGISCRTRPAVSLVLERDRGRNGCSKPPVLMKFVGNDRREVDEAEYFVRGRLVKIDRRRPFQQRLQRGQLGDGGRVKLRARVTLIDGRRVGWERRIRICRAG